MTIVITTSYQGHVRISLTQIKKNGFKKEWSSEHIDDIECCRVEN